MTAWSATRRPEYPAALLSVRDLSQRTPGETQYGSRNLTTPLDGAWKMTQVTYYPKNGAPEVDNHPVQYKVFQSGNLMWANTHMDSATQKPVTAYGYGTFEIKGTNQAVETMTSSTYRSALVGKPVTLQLKFLDRDHYEQTIVSPDGDRSVEVYERLK